MFLLFVIGGCVIIIAIIVVIVKRLRLTKQSEQLSAKIGRIPSYDWNKKYSQLFPMRIVA